MIWYSTVLIENPPLPSTYYRPTKLLNIEYLVGDWIQNWIGVEYAAANFYLALVLSQMHPVLLNRQWTSALFPVDLLILVPLNFPQLYQIFLAAVYLPSSRDSKLLYPRCIQWQKRKIFLFSFCRIIGLLPVNFQNFSLIFIDIIFVFISTLFIEIFIAGGTNDMNTIKKRLSRVIVTRVFIRVR